MGAIAFATADTIFLLSLAAFFFFFFLLRLMRADFRAFSLMLPR